MNVQREIVFGCSLRDITTQFGLNQNASIFNITVVQEATQRFTLWNKPRHGIRYGDHVQVGALKMWGLVQSWDEQEIGISGSGVFTIRFSDFRPAMEGIQVFLEAPLDVKFGENVVAVAPATVEDLTSGLEYSRVKKAIEAQTFSYGDIKFKVDLGTFTINPRSVEGESVPYRVQGGAMSLVEFVQHVADEHGFEWYVSTSKHDDHYIVSVVPIIRNDSDIDMKGLAALHPEKVARLVRGHESRDEITRTVVIGAHQQYLSKEPSRNWKPFWGFTEDGDVLDGPEFKLVFKDGTARRRKTTLEEMEKAINGEITDLPDEELSALRSYAEEYWGKQFYANVSDKQIDTNGDPWIDVTSGGWWSENSNPEHLPEEGEVKYGTEDGRWTSFVRLVPPSQAGSAWQDGVITSAGFLATGFNRFYMKCSVERIDLHRAEDVPQRQRKGSIFLLILASPLAVTTQRSHIVTEQGRQQTGQISTGVPLSGQDAEQPATRTIRMATIGDVYLALVDRRHTYGPWTSDDLIPPAMRLHGKTRVVVDSSLAPWTFGYRGITNRKAWQLLNKVATARIRTYTHRFSEIDTGELEVADLPAVNLGRTIGRGTNVTAINVNYDIRGLRTIYKCQVYTNELGRYQRYYQELVDKLRRDAQKKQNTLYPQANYRVMDRELSALKKDMGNNGSGLSSNPLTGDSSYIARIIDREKGGIFTYGPHYLCQVYKESVVDGYIQLTQASVGGVKTTNISEDPNSPARVSVGKMVRIRPARTNLYKGAGGKSIAAISAWVMEEQADKPGPMRATVLGNLGWDPMYRPMYRVRLLGNPDVSMLTDEELGLAMSTKVHGLGAVVNIAEPVGSPPALPNGTEVTVNWQVWQDEKSFTDPRILYDTYMNVNPGIFYPFKG